jgi:ribosomal protein S27E
MIYSTCDICPDCRQTEIIYSTCDICPDCRQTEITYSTCDICPDCRQTDIIYSTCDICPDCRQTEIICFHVQYRILPWLQMGEKLSVYQGHTGLHLKIRWIEIICLQVWYSTMSSIFHVQYNSLSLLDTDRTDLLPHAMCTGTTVFLTVNRPKP